MKNVKRSEAKELVNRCFGRHQSPDHAVGTMLVQGKVTLEDLAHAVLVSYEARNPYRK